MRKFDEHELKKLRNTMQQNPPLALSSMLSSEHPKHIHHDNYINVLTEKSENPSPSPPTTEQDKKENTVYPNRFPSTPIHPVR